MSASIETYRAIIAELASSLGAGASPTPAEVKRLRKQFGQDRVNELLSVASLQKKACQKFGDGVWWVTEKSLQQATAWQVAKIKSAWIGQQRVYDLCCGIGGDAMQLASRADVVAIDLDPVMATFAEANLQEMASRGPLGKAEVRCGDATEVPLPSGVGVHIDPDRRSGGKRTTRPEDYQPGLDQVLQVARPAVSAIIKLAPAAEVPVAMSDATHRCWISLSGRVREQVVLVGEAVERSGQVEGTRSAVSVRADGSFRTFSLSAHQRQQGANDRSHEASGPGAVLVDPDASVRAAGLTDAFAKVHALSLLGGPAGFLTCEASEVGRLSEDVMAVVGRVIWAGGCDHRKLRRELRNRDYYPEVIKVRGTGHDPAKWSQQLRSCGTIPITLWIGRAAGRVFAAICE
ncbi:methyltransferase domain-containing protein [Novipirellula artificiosorum]|uniref:Methyltransferase domain-containing protein n=1 Tax=Novipirellula artificiosorum TaxID=2528016 RepID=A0A5C6DA59_9BACT|nr:methyltransferase domain-containing protein [Novipirellula artificiosorum]TWU33780.1 hypothetical protein Poly41_47780 [Novipirellula artificiosorum]